MRRISMVGTMLLGGVVVALGIAVGAGISALRSTDTYTVTVGGGVSPHLSETDVASLAKEWLGAMRVAAGDAAKDIPTDIASITAGDEATVEAITGSTPETTAAGQARLYWIIVAKGPFFVTRVPPGLSPRLNDSGYIIIDDEAGEVRGWGTPAP